MRSSIATKGRLFCFSVMTSALLGACVGPKGQDPAPQNDTLYALPAGLNAEVGDEVQLGAQRVKGGEATNVSDKVKWTSDKPSVVTVDEKGVATAVGIGDAKISTTLDGKTATVNVSVVGRIKSVEVEAAAINLAKNTVYQLSTIGLVEDKSKRALTAAQAWGSSDEDVATVSDDGTVTAVGPGTATITLTYGGKTYTRTVTVLDVTLDSISIEPAVPARGTTIPVGLTTPFAVTGTFTGGHEQDITNLFETSVSDKDGEFISADGADVTALGLPKGKTEFVGAVTFTGKKDTAADGAEQDLAITVIDATTLSLLEAVSSSIPTKISLHGEPFKPAFNGTYGTTVFRTPVKLTVDSTTKDDKNQYVEIVSGTVRPVKVGTVTVTGTVEVPVEGSDKPRKVTASVDVEIVDAALTSVTLTSAEDPPTTTVNVGKAINLNAIANFGSVTQTVTKAALWESATPGTALVSNVVGGEGTVTGVSPGLVEIKAYYGDKIGTIQITVIP